MAFGGGHEAAPGGFGLAGLHAGDARVFVDQQRVVVVEVELAALDRERQDRFVGADDLGDARLGHVEVREHGEVGGAGVVAAVVEARRRGVARAAEPQTGGFFVHAHDELVDGSGDVLGERDGGVVAGGQQQAVEQALQAHMPAERQHADLRALHVDGLAGDEHGRVGRRGLDGQERGHHLGEARDRHAQVWVVLPEHLAG